MKNKKILLICLFAILIIGGGTGVYYYKTHYITATLEKVRQTEITGALNRSDCGWYQLYSYYLRPNMGLNSDELYLEETDSTGYIYRLSLLEFNLAEYAGGDLDQSALENIRQIFSIFSKTKSKVIVRFLYDWDGLGTEKEPHDISIIEKHMEQTSKILNEYSDIIYTTQGIFVGSWAEMHGSKYLTDEAMTRLLVHYASVTSPSIYLAVRTPNQYRTIFRELEEHPKRYKSYHITTNKLKKRLGLYNDGMLGSISDIGTYQGWNTENADLTEKELRAKELSFQNTLCLTVPNGGEVINNNVYNNGKRAVADLQSMHVSYLNQMHDESVINKWKNTTYTGKNSLYNGASYYDYITDHMGARFVLRDCSLSYEPFQHGPATGTVTIENVGFSNLYHPKHFTLSLQNEETGQSFPLLDSKKEEDAIDPCDWNSGESIAIPFTFSPFDLEDGNYILIASLTETTNKEPFSFANDSFEDALEGYRLGTITIKR